MVVGFSVLMSRTYNRTGASNMRIETLILILIMTVAVGFVIDRFDVKRFL
jgi:hypothetical protein